MSSRDAIKTGEYERLMWSTKLYDSNWYSVPTFVSFYSFSFSTCTWTGFRFINWTIFTFVHANRHWSDDRPDQSKQCGEPQKLLSACRVFCEPRGLKRKLNTVGESTTSSGSGAQPNPWPTVDPFPRPSIYVHRPLSTMSTSDDATGADASSRGGQQPHPVSTHCGSIGLK